MMVQNPSGFVRFMIISEVVMRENSLIEKSIAFASRIIKLYQYLITTKKEMIISKQIVRSGTSIGANINEANYGQSILSFIAIGWEFLEVSSNYSPCPST